jgi:hypothetical protein
MRPHRDFPWQALFFKTLVQKGLFFADEVYEVHFSIYFQFCVTNSRAISNFKRPHEHRISRDFGQFRPILLRVCLRCCEVSKDGVFELLPRVPQLLSRSVFDNILPYSTLQCRRHGEPYENLLLEIAEGNREIFAYVVPLPAITAALAFVPSIPMCAHVNRERQALPTLVCGSPERLRLSRPLRKWHSRRSRYRIPNRIEDTRFWYMQKVPLKCVNLKYCFAERRMQLSKKFFWVQPLIIAAMHDGMPLP